MAPGGSSKIAGAGHDPRVAGLAAWSATTEIRSWAAAIRISGPGLAAQRPSLASRRSRHETQRLRPGFGGSDARLDSCDSWRGFRAARLGSCASRLVAATLGAAVALQDSKAAPCFAAFALVHRAESPWTGPLRSSLPAREQARQSAAQCSRAQPQS